MKPSSDSLQARVLTADKLTHTRSVCTMNTAGACQLVHAPVCLFLLTMAYSMYHEASITSSLVPRSLISPNLSVSSFAPLHQGSVKRQYLTSDFDISYYFSNLRLMMPSITVSAWLSAAQSTHSYVYMSTYFSFPVYSSPSFHTYTNEFNFLPSTRPVLKD